MKRIILSICALCMLNASWALENLTVGNTTRTMIVYAPRDLPEQPPLIIACHGANQDAPYLQSLAKFETVADTAKFVVVYANGVNKYWDISGDSDLKFMDAIIDAMNNRYNVDRNRVYLTGFSMGGMFTYYCATKRADKFAAFAPVSGYLMGGPNATSTRAVPILHTHGTADDVCVYSGVQQHIDAWVRFNGCSTTPQIIKPYPASKPNSPAEMKRYRNGRDGVEVALLTLADKGHWWSMDPVQALTSEEVWNFCKRYSLDMKDPSVRFIEPETPPTFVTIGGTTEIEPFTITAEASDPDGSIVKVAFYDGETLLASKSRAPYTYKVNSLNRGTHKLKAVATDNDGRTATAVMQVEVTEPTTNFLISKVFTTEGSVPEGWVTFDGAEKRIGFSSGYTSGSRVFHFTGETHDYEWGLYTRNINGNTREGYARYGDPASTTMLTLYPGNYQMMMRISNWNREDNPPVTVAIEKTDGEEVYSETFQPTSNIGNNAANDFSGTTLTNIYFDILEKGRYVITFYTSDQPWADLVVGQAAIRRKGSVVTGISDNKSERALDVNSKREVYDLQGRRIDGNGTMKRGIYISNGRLVIH